MIDWLFISISYFINNFALTDEKETILNIDYKSFLEGGFMQMISNNLRITEQ